MSFLDMFAGSGALGLEAASNGAARVVMLEKDRKTASAISLVISKLQAQDVAQCFAADAFVWLKQSDEVFDVIFIDPPFALSLHLPFPMLYFSRHDKECFPPVPFALRSGLAYSHGSAQCTPLFRR